MGSIITFSSGKHSALWHPLIERLWREVYLCKPHWVSAFTVIAGITHQLQVLTGFVWWKMKASEQVHLQMILKRLSHCMASILSELPLFFSLFSPPASITFGFPLKCCFKFVAILVFLGFHLPLALLRKKKEVECENAKSQNKKCLIIQVLRINCRLFK